MAIDITSSGIAELNLTGRDFLQEADFSAAELTSLVELAEALKVAKPAPNRDCWPGRTSPSSSRSHQLGRAAPSKSRPPIKVRTLRTLTRSPPSSDTKNPWPTPPES